MARTNNAFSCNYQDVNAAINGGPDSRGVNFVALTDGDKCQLPADTSLAWTQLLRITKNITLVGSGTWPSPTSIITGAGASGSVLSWTTNKTVIGSNEATATLANITFNCSGSSGSAITWAGLATCQYNAANKLVGGIRMTNVKMVPVAGKTSRDWVFLDWVTGVVDHCWLLYPTSGFAGSVIDINHPTAPGVTTGATVTTGSDTYKTLYGWYSFSDRASYVLGGGPDVNGVHDAIYFEDCIFDKQTYGTSATDIGNPSHGGGRYVARHCTSGCALGSHGFSESGADCGLRVAEFYNNLMVSAANVANTPHEIRAGVGICANSRFIWSKNAPLATYNFRREDTSGTMIGPSDGTNFWDQNARGTILDGNGNSISPDGGAQPSNTRIGNIYARGVGTSSGTATTTTTLKLPLTSVTGKFDDFELRNDSRSAADTTGCQTIGPTGYWCGRIASSTASGSDTTFVVNAGHDGHMSIGPSDSWSVRKVISQLGAPGGGEMPLVNGGGVKENVNNGFPKFVTSVGASPNPNWTIDGTNFTQASVGCWQKNNKYKATSGGTYAASAGISGISSAVLGGNNNNALPSDRGDGQTYTNPSYTYALANAANAAAQNALRIGADWNPTDSGLAAWSGGAATSYDWNDLTNGLGTSGQGVGYKYPHPLVSGVVGPPPVVQAPVINSVLSASSTIGSTFSYTITATNNPTSFNATQMPFGFTVSTSTGVISCTAGNNIGQPGVYAILISATNAGGTSESNLILTLDGGLLLQRGKGRAHKIGTLSNRQ